jgi:hypothetical protein
MPEDKIEKLNDKKDVSLEKVKSVQKSVDEIRKEIEASIESSLEFLSTKINNSKPEEQLSEKEKIIYNKDYESLSKLQNQYKGFSAKEVLQDVKEKQSVMRNVILESALNSLEKSINNEGNNKESSTELRRTISEAIENPFDAEKKNILIKEINKLNELKKSSDKTSLKDYVKPLFSNYGAALDNLARSNLSYDEVKLTQRDVRLFMNSVEKKEDLKYFKFNYLLPESRISVASKVGSMMSALQQKASKAFANTSSAPPVTPQNMSNNKGRGIN